jgi:hypothetical protein
MHKQTIFPMPEIKIEKETVNSLLKEYPNSKEELMAVSMQLSSPTIQRSNR